MAFKERHINKREELAFKHVSLIGLHIFTDFLEVSMKHPDRVEMIDFFKSNAHHDVQESMLQLD